MRIYTRTGDQGETALLDGSQASKADPRVAAYGDVDELNATIGLAVAAGVDPDLATLLHAIQRDLFALGAQLADPKARVASRVDKAAIGTDAVRRLEQAIDRYDEQLPPLRRFLLPGGSSAAAALHQARAVCRRAERSTVALGADSIPGPQIQYLNRLSDLLFVIARTVNHRHGVADQEW